MNCLRTDQHPPIPLQIMPFQKHFHNPPSLTIILCRFSHHSMCPLSLPLILLTLGGVCRIFSHICHTKFWLPHQNLMKYPSCCLGIDTHNHTPPPPLPTLHASMFYKLPSYSIFLFLVLVVCHCGSNIICPWICIKKTVGCHLAKSLFKMDSCQEI